MRIPRLEFNSQRVLNSRWCWPYPFLYSSSAKRFANFKLFDKLKEHATDLYEDHTDTETYDDILEPFVENGDHVKDILGDKFFPDEEEEPEDFEDEEVEEDTTAEKTKVKKKVRFLLFCFLLFFRLDIKRVSKFDI